MVLKVEITDSSLVLHFSNVLEQLAACKVTAVVIPLADIVLPLEIISDKAGYSQLTGIRVGLGVPGLVLSGRKVHVGGAPPDFVHTHYETGRTLVVRVCEGSSCGWGKAVFDVPKGEGTPEELLARITAAVEQRKLSI